MKFGFFMMPAHRPGESPTLAFDRDLELIEFSESLGYDEFWIGEHHSAGWEIIPSPEIFIAAAAQRTTTIRLGTGVVNLPYHDPFLVALDDLRVLRRHLVQRLERAKRDF